MRIGLIGTGAISHKHAQAYQSIGFRVTVCTNRSEESGRRFASQYGAQFVPTYEEVCRHPEVDIVDVCTYPDFRRPAVPTGAWAASSNATATSSGTVPRNTMPAPGKARGPAKGAARSSIRPFTRLT